MTNNNKSTALIVPGIGYTADRSLLYFAGKLAEKAGFGTVRIRLDGFEKGIKGDKEKLDRAISHGYGLLMDQLPDQESLFISKSIGTALSLMADLEKEIGAAHILFTPLPETISLLDEILSAQGEERAGDFLVFHGKDDPWARDNSGMRAEVERLGIAYYEIDGANHSLETGDPLLDLCNQQRIMGIVKDFLGKKEGSGAVLAN